MAIIRNNFMNLALKQKLVGAQIVFYDEQDEINVTKTVQDFEYDSMTHEFIIEFTNGDTQTFSDKFKFDMESIDVTKLTSNKKRGKQKKIR